MNYEQVSLVFLHFYSKYLLSFSYSPHSSMENLRSPKPQERENHSSSTTFVHAHTSNFKQVVQILTGSSQTAKQASQDLPPPPSSSSKSSIPPKKQGFKLYERRNININSLLKNNLVVVNNPKTCTSLSGSSPLSSPSLLDFPKLALTSPVNQNPDADSLGLTRNTIEEEKAMAEKGFYLHPSPRTTNGDGDQPQLLPLFPVESPRVSSGSSS